tara:strand:+ start:288 stop:428 length:141 start_codon:yes stop_codon:yes gene_type:complete
MGLTKQHNKLLRLQTKAQKCISRKEAQEIIKKAEKTHKKVTDKVSL